MRTIGIAGAAALSLILGGAVPAFADDNKTTTTTTTKTTTVTKTDPKMAAERDAWWASRRATAWDNEHRTWVQRGGYKGFMIPEDKYNMYFGPEHSFRLNSLPYRVVSNDPRFQYNGYWMSVVDPWPESWANTWYNDDDVYVRYFDNGYYLFNTRYPDTGLAIHVWPQ